MPASVFFCLVLFKFYDLNFNFRALLPKINAESKIDDFKIVDFYLTLS